MYRTVDTATWTDPKIKKLSPKGKLLFLYLFTNQHSHASGIYYLPRKIQVMETGLSDRVLDTLWDTLSGLSLAFHDPENDIIWVKRMFFYQGRGEKLHRGAANHLASLHNSFLINHFLSEYPAVEEFVSDRVLHGVSDRVLHRVSEFGTPNQNQNQNQDQEQNQEPPIPPTGGLSGFSEFWEAYPRKVGKGAARRSWKKIKPDPELQEKILDSVVQHSYSFEWTRENGQYIPHPVTYLNQERWEDEVKKAPAAMSKEDHLADVERRLKE